MMIEAVPHFIFSFFGCTPFHSKRLYKLSHFILYIILSSLCYVRFAVYFKTTLYSNLFSSTTPRFTKGHTIAYLVDVHLLFLTAFNAIIFGFSKHSSTLAVLKSIKSIHERLSAPQKLYGPIISPLFCLHLAFWLSCIIHWTSYGTRPKEIIIMYYYLNCTSLGVILLFSLILLKLRDCFEVVNCSLRKELHSMSLGSQQSIEELNSGYSKLIFLEGLHHELSTYVEEISDIFSLRVLSVLLLKVEQFILTSYLLILQYNPKLKPTNDPMYGALLVIWLIAHSFQLLLLLRSSSSLLKQAQKGKWILVNYFSMSDNMEIGNIIRRMTDRKVVIKPKGVLCLGVNLIPGAVDCIMTYVILLLKFHQDDS